MRLPGGFKTGNLAAFHIGTPLYHTALSPAFKNRGMPVSVPLNGNKGRAENALLRAYRNRPFPAERAVQAVLVLKYPDTVFCRKTYNTHTFSIY
jgi:hypothetical protein